MNYFAGFLLIFFSVVSCQNTVDKSALKSLNGYWEIEKAVFSDGKEKEYTINETIDFFELSGNSGYRKKMKPQFDGKYLVSGHSEKVDLQIGEKVYLHYSTSFAKWKEEIIKISPQNLILKNDNEVEYHYRRPVPFSIK